MVAPPNEKQNREALVALTRRYAMTVAAYGVVAELAALIIFGLVPTVAGGWRGAPPARCCSTRAPPPPPSASSTRSVRRPRRPSRRCPRSSRARPRACAAAAARALLVGLVVHACALLHFRAYRDASARAFPPPRAAPERVLDAARHRLRLDRVPVALAARAPGHNARPRRRARRRRPPPPRSPQTTPSSTPRPSRPPRASRSSRRSRSRRRARRWCLWASRLPAMRSIRPRSAVWSCSSSGCWASAHAKEGA